LDANSGIWLRGGISRRIGQDRREVIAKPVYRAINRKKKRVIGKTA
jgi:hypothetical protein